MIKHDGSPSSLNAGDAAHDELDRQLEVELALHRIELARTQVVTGYHDLVSLLEEERLELQGAQELAALLGKMVRE